MRAPQWHWNQIHTLGAQCKSVRTTLLVSSTSIPIVQREWINVMRFSIVYTRVCSWLFSKSNHWSVDICHKSHSNACTTFFFYFSLFIKIYKQTKWCRWLFTSNTKTNHMKSEWKKMQWIKNELVCGLERVILRKWARNFCLLWIWFSFLRKWQHTLISFLRPFDGI